MSQYEDYLASLKVEDDKRNQVVSSLSEAATTNPDEFANMVKLSRAAKISLEAVPEYKEEAQQAKFLGDVGLDRLWKDAPKTTQFLATPDHAKMASDDIENLSGIEGALRIAKNSGRALAQVIPRINEGIYGAAAAPFELLGIDSVGGYLRDQQKNSQAWGKYVGPQGKSSGNIESGFYSGITSAGQNLLSLPLAFLPGGQGAALAAMTIPVFGESYGKGRDAGLSPAQSIQFGTQDAAAEYVFERYGLGNLVKNVKSGTGLGKTVVQYMMREVPSEMATTVVQSFNEYANINPSKPVGEWLAQLPDELAQTVVATIVGGAAISTSAKAVQKTMQIASYRQQEVQDAERGAGFIETLNKFIGASTTLQRDPETFEKFIAQATEDGPVENVYVNAQTLQQSGLAEQLAQVSPAVAEQLQTALETGGDIRIPVAEYATKIAPTEFAQSLVDHLKVDENGFSRAEAQEYMQSQGAELQSHIERIMAENEGDTTFKASVDAVKENIRSQLDTANRFTPQNNEAFSTLTATFFATTAARLGMTPEALYAKYPLRVVAESIAGQQFDQSGNQKTDTPEFRNWFGDSKVVDASGKPMVVYHGTRNEFSVFDYSRIGEQGRAEGAGFYFTNSKDVASGYGKPMEVHLSIKNPMAYDAKPFKKSVVEKIVKRVAELEAQADGVDIGDGFLSNFGDVNYQGLNSVVKDAANLIAADNTALDQLSGIVGSGVNPAHVNQATRDITGHDGVVANGFSNGGDSTNKIFVAFFPEQIKSVNNRGTFDPNDANILNQSAYHGSPHHFDKFSLEHMGKGEGNQAYGWGLYFAGDRQVAEWYAGKLSESVVQFKNKQPKTGAEKSVMDLISKRANNSQYEYRAEQARKAWNDLASPLKDRLYGNDYLRIKPLPADELAKVLELQEAAITLGEPSLLESGQLYEVNIPEDDTMLLWDKPLSEQPEAVKKSLGNVVDLLNEERGTPGSKHPDLSFSGSGIYGFVSKAMGGDEAASKYLNSLGINGIKYLDGTSRNAGDGSFNYVIFDDAAVQVLQTYYQNNGANRGSFNPATMQMSLLKPADLSTFLHESAHFFLEVQFDLAAQLQQDANIHGTDTLKEGEKEYLRDSQAVLDWFGIKDIAEWNSLDFEEKRSYHERYAESFEAYLFSGKAPSIELAPLFQKFRAFLTSVYTSLKNFLAGHPEAGKLTDEVRSVFDKMLATNEQIMLAEQARSMMPLFDANDGTITPEEYASLQALGIAGTNEAIQELQAKGLRDLQWARNAKSKELRRLQRESKGIREELTMQARREIMSQPVYQVWSFLTNKESLDELPSNNQPALSAGRLDMAGLSEIGLPADIINHLKALRMTAKDGLHPDMVAEVVGGFGSGDEMVRAIVSAKPPKEAIADRAQELMEQNHGELANDEAIDRAADKAIHNEVRARAVEAELNALAKAMNVREPTGNLDKNGKPITRPVLATAAREFAAQMIGRLKIRDIKPSQYANSEAKAARSADKSKKAGDVAQAMADKRNQLINLYLTRAAYNGQDEAGDIVRYLSKFDREGTRKALSRDYLVQIDAILERFDLRKGQSLKAIDKRESLAKFIESQVDAGIEPEIPDWLVLESNKTHYKNLTLDELRAVNESVRQIEHLGRLKNKLLTAKDARELNEIVQEITESMIANSAGEVDNEARNTVGSKISQMWRGAMAAHRKAASVVREMDGFKDGGPMWEYFIRSMNEAGDREASMRAEAAEKLHALAKPVMDAGKLGGKGKYFPALNRNLNRGEILAMALNIGNESNLQRLLGGKNWTVGQIKPALDTLSATDWAFVQGVWDFFESYRPQIGAKQMRVYGTEPDWIEAGNPFLQQLSAEKGLSLRGGYYPVKYDPRQSGKSAEFDEKQAAQDMMRAANTAATTRRSFTKSRVEEVKGRPLLLRFDGIWQGANEVIHDLTWHEWLIDANRLMKRLDEPMRNQYGHEYVDVLRTSIKDSALGDMPASNRIQSGLNHLRIGATVAGLGWNLTTSLLQPIGLTQSVVRIGAPWVARGLKSFYSHPVNMAEEVQAKSEFMRNRGRTFMREINDVRNRLESDKGEVRSMLESSYFVLIQKMQATVDYPTWLGAYEKAIASGNDEARAVGLADQAVIDSQGGGQIKDLAQVQRGHPIFKLFTNFYSFFNMALNLTVERTKGTDFKKPAEVAALAGDYLLLLVLPSAIGAVLKSVLKGGDDDEEKLLKKIAEEQIGFLLGLFVGLRELTGFAQMALGVGNPGIGYSGPAGARFFAEMQKLGQQIGQGEADMALFKAANSSAGILFHYPAGQVNRAVEGSAALIEGRTNNPLAPLVGPPPKN